MCNKIIFKHKTKEKKWILVSVLVVFINCIKLTNTDLFLFSGIYLCLVLVCDVSSYVGQLVVIQNCFILPPWIKTKNDAPT